MYKQQDLIRKNSRICRSSEISVREKAQSYGVSALDTSELIALLTGVKIEEVRKVMGTYRSVKNTLAAMEGADSMKNIKATAALRIAQIAFTEDLEHTVLDSPEKAGQYLIGKMSHMTNEVFCILCLDSQNRLLRFEEICRGTVSETPVYPRQVLSFALEKNSRCVGIILAHVHPGGSPEPSKHDIEVTKKLKTAADVFGVKVLDHIIVADNKYISLAGKGLI